MSRIAGMADREAVPLWRIRSRQSGGDGRRVVESGAADQGRCCWCRRTAWRGPDRGGRGREEARRHIVRHSAQEKAMKGLWIAVAALAAAPALASAQGTTGQAQGQAT